MVLFRGVGSAWGTLGGMEKPSSQAKRCPRIQLQSWFQLRFIQPLKTSALASSSCSLLARICKGNLPLPRVPCFLSVIAASSSAFRRIGFALCLSGPSMNSGGAPAQCSLANVGGLLPCATEDRQVRELQGPPHPAPGLHIDAVVYPPPHYTPVRVGLHSRHIRKHAATVPESCR
jgi:hypothetical protein